MNPKCSVYIATSVDEYIARPDGDIDWLQQPEYDMADMKGLRYDDFIADVDALVMGWNTYEKALSFPTWPYENLMVIVLSSKVFAIPESLQDKVRQEVHGSPEQDCCSTQYGSKKASIH